MFLAAQLRDWLNHVIVTGGFWACFGVLIPWSTIGMLRRKRWITLRVILSVLAGVATFYLIGFALRFGSTWLFYRYCDGFGLVPFIACSINPSYSEGKLFGIDFLVMMGFWTFLFGTLYLCFVFRGQQPI
jgi:hypothetical protein